MLKIGTLFALLLLFGAMTAGPALATSNTAYNSGEYVVVDGGLSPDKRFSIATHGGGDLGYDNFHAYLMAEPAHKTIAALSSVDRNFILDTNADAHHAVWSPELSQIRRTLARTLSISIVTFMTIVTTSVRRVQFSSRLNLA